MCWVKTTYTLYYEILAISCLETTYINTTMTTNTNLLKDTSSWYLSNEQISKLSAVLQSCLPLQYHIDKIFSHEQYSIFFLPLLAITMHSVLECHKLTLICLQKIICTQNPRISLQCIPIKIKMQLHMHLHICYKYIHTIIHTQYVCILKYTQQAFENIISKSDLCNRDSS